MQAFISGSDQSLVPVLEDLSDPDAFDEDSNSQQSRFDRAYDDYYDRMQALIDTNQLLLDYESDEYIPTRLGCMNERIAAARYLSQSDLDSLVSQVEGWYSEWLDNHNTYDAVCT